LAGSWLALIDLSRDLQLGHRAAWKNNTTCLPADNADCTAVEL